MHLLKYFDKLSLRPENAKEIRKVILDLAIRGQLTIDWRKNNLNVENASVLIDQIKSEKTRLIAEKKTRKGKPLAAVKVEAHYWTFLKRSRESIRLEFTTTPIYAVSTTR